MPETASAPEARATAVADAVEETEAPATETAAAEDRAPQDAPTRPAALDGGEAESEPDLAAELRAVEEAAGEEMTAVLTAALDRLGAAHHRPFSRS